MSLAVVSGFCDVGLGDLGISEGFDNATVVLEFVLDMLLVSVFDSILIKAGFGEIFLSIL